MRVFIDASVLLAAAGSLTGASFSALLVMLGAAHYVSIVSRQVLTEARANVSQKFDRTAELRLRALVGELMPIPVDVEATDVPDDLPPSVAEKDHHVIRACIAARASICLSLDRRHLLRDEVRAWGLARGLRFLTPGEFLAWHRGQGNI